MLEVIDDSRSEVIQQFIKGEKSIGKISSKNIY
jgi:hypothetical protein